MYYFYCVFFFLLGCVLGSFYGVVATRLPKNESLIKPRSHCEECNETLAWFELIPVLSFLIQKGKCRHCKTKLSKVHILIEISTGLLFLFAYLYYDISYSFFISIILSSLVILIFVSDMKYMIILDSPLIISAISIFFLKWFYFDLSNAFLSLFEGMLSFFTMFAIGKIGNVLFKRESLGGGDIKLSFLFGEALGIQMAFAAFVLSTFLALPYAFACLFMRNNHEVPFGPFLVSALWIVFLFSEKFKNVLDVFFHI